MYLYHITYASRLPGIEDDGLLADQPRSIGSGAYDSHRGGRVFATEQDGVFFWYARAEEWAEHNSDDLLEDELVPVVLRFSDGFAESEDEEGTRDARAQAWIVSEIPPEEIEVWDGEGWSTLDAELDIESALVDLNDDESDPWWTFSHSHENPLLPSSEDFDD